MKATFSVSAEAILARNRDFQKALLAAIEPLPGNCFIDGKVGRIAQNDELAIMCQGHNPITITNDDLKLASTVSNIVAKLSTPDDY
jgi:hypothetical protein